MAKTIKLKLITGETALIDRTDYHLVKEYVWRRGGTENRYAASLLDLGDTITTIYLHRLVMCAGSKDIIDHINGNPLDCRKENLRFVTSSQNAANRTFTNNPFGYRGVCYFPKKRKFQARLMEGGGVFRSPYYKTPVEAARYYDKLARGLFGEYATYNFPEEGERGVIPKKSDNEDSED
ncbi:MAG: HNH endonuclease [Methylocystaceae bacterium]|nr:HNH endonuclease [Methylocystaceae bacterium]